ncbi:MAG: hypothetical protein ACFFG0_42920 [Candidatus Thorarchaeota archaeon]
MSTLKNGKKVIIGLFIIFFFFSFFSRNAISATTIGDTIFPADVGKTYTWIVTYPSEANGTKFTFTTESIEKGVHNTINTLIVNCTIRVYHPMVGWYTFIDNKLYMAANNTQNYLAFENYNYPVITPTPINLTLVAKAMYDFNYSIVDNTIIENNIYGIWYEFTFNTKGFLTKGILKQDGIMYMKFVLATGGDAIPFSNFFLIFTVISVIALVYLKKQNSIRS